MMKRDLLTGARALSATLIADRQPNVGGFIGELADEIERLRSALEPFAKALPRLNRPGHPDISDVNMRGADLRLADFERAHKAVR